MQSSQNTTKFQRNEDGKRGSRVLKTNKKNPKKLKKKYQAEGLMLLDFMIYDDCLQYLKTVWHWQKDKVQTHIHTHIRSFDFKKRYQCNSLGKVSFNKWYRKT